MSDVPRTTGIDERTQNDNGTVDAPVAEAKMATTTADGSSPSGLYRVMVTSVNAVRVGPTPDATDDPPQFAMASYDRMVAENAEVGSIVGDPVQAVPAS